MQISLEQKPPCITNSFKTKACQYYSSKGDMLRVTTESQYGVVVKAFIQKPEDHEL